MKFLVVDDHALIRDAMHDLLGALQPGVEVLTAMNAVQARQALCEHPDIGLVLLDLNLPDADGLELLAEWRDEHPATAVVVLSGNHDPATARAALAGGASGFIPKSDSRDVLLRALALVLAGGVYVPAFALQAAALRTFSRGRPAVGRRPADAPGAGAHHAPARRAGADDARPQQQADRAGAEPGRADGEKPCDSVAARAEGGQSHRGGGGGHGLGLGHAVIAVGSTMSREPSARRAMG
jgi:DNA-binding NarL/FixJ family response regulator